MAYDESPPSQSSMIVVKSDSQSNTSSQQMYSNVKSDSKSRLPLWYRPIPIHRTHTSIGGNVKLILHRMHQLKYIV
jgi:hypothetical protein